MGRRGKRTEEQGKWLKEQGKWNYGRSEGFDRIACIRIAYIR